MVFAGAPFSFEGTNRLKRLVIMGLFSDDELADILVLKGGNALALVHNLGHRGSLDLDFSLEGDFPPGLLPELGRRVEAALNKVFEPEGLIAFDVAVRSVPPEVTPDMAAFWGGYRIGFKLAESDLFVNVGGNREIMRKRAVLTGPQNRRTVLVDISKYEFCGRKETKELEGLAISVYSPSMIVCEKLRAICQQTEAYCALAKRRGSARARDFFDIHATMRRFPIELGSPANRQLLQDIFAAKRVALELLGEIKQQEAFHAPDFDSVRATVPAGTDLEPFKFYFDYVVGLCDMLSPLG